MKCHVFYSFIIIIIIIIIIIHKNKTFLLEGIYQLRPYNIYKNVITFSLAAFQFLKQEPRLKEERKENNAWRCFEDSSIKAGM